MRRSYVSGTLKPERSFSWLWLVALRYLRSKRKEKSNVATLLSISGIAVGVAALIIVLGVMNGFQFSTISNILELSSYHLRVSSDHGYSYSEARDAAAHISGYQGVRSAVPFAEVQSLLQGPLREPAGVLIRGIPDDIREQDPGFAEKLHMHSGSLRIRDQQIVIGMELSRRLGARVGDTVNLIHFEGSGVLRPQEAVYQVAGIYSTEYFDFDRNYVFVHIEQAVTQLGAAGVMVGVKLEDRFADRVAKNRILQGLDYPVEIQRWREFDRAVFGALQLEKSLMTFLLGMVFVVVGVNIFQSLRRSVIERTEELGVLKAMGAAPRAVQSLFVLEGALIGCIGATLGGVGGVVLAGRLDETLSFFRSIGGQAVASPALWSHIPVELVVHEVAAIIAIAVLSTVLAGYAASRRVAGIVPAEVLRNE